MQPVSTWLASACLFPTRECSARHFHGADLSARSCFQTIRDRCLVPKSVTNHLDEYTRLTLFRLDLYHGDSTRGVTLSGSCSREYLGTQLVRKSFLSIVFTYLGQPSRRTEQAFAARTHAGQGQGHMHAVP